jgi:hypothetical protein
MDDATMHYLVKRRIEYTPAKQPLDKAYKEKIIKLTKQLMETKLEGAIQDAFDNYVSECMTHFNRLEKKEVIIPPVLECDKIMYPPKKIETFVKQKNINILYEKRNP